MNKRPLPLNPNFWTGFIIILLFVFAAPAAVRAQVIFVDADASAGGDGTSWGFAYNTLQDALADAESGDEIWVAEGIYFPDEGGSETNNDRTATFQLIDGVEIYGGFDGTEGSLNDRDINNNPTILSGDIDGDDTTTDGVVTDTDDISGSNSFHVVNGTGTDDTALLDGFTITVGRADGGGSDDRGGGLFIEAGGPTLAHITFSGNSAVFGGGINNLNGSSGMTNVILIRNSADTDGGGIYNSQGSNPVLTGGLLTGNTAGSSGGGIFSLTSDPVFRNVTFSDNSAGTNGGAIAGDVFSPDPLNPSDG